MIKIAVDAMGSDNGSSIVVEAVKQFLKDYKDVELTVFGKKEELVGLEGLIKAYEYGCTNLYEFADYFDVSLDYLLGRSDKEKWRF